MQRVLDGQIVGNHETQTLNFDLTGVNTLLDLQTPFRLEDWACEACSVYLTKYDKASAGVYFCRLTKLVEPFFISKNPARQKWQKCCC